MENIKSNEKNALVMVRMNDSLYNDLKRTSKEIGIKMSKIMRFTLKKYLYNDIATLFEYKKMDFWAKVNYFLGGLIVGLSLYLAGVLMGVI